MVDGTTNYINAVVIAVTVHDTVELISVESYIMLLLEAVDQPEILF